ncbi:SDR family NAD(P)-dependent oxidoreductase [Elioraea rosea]|uniref:SDR family NAD(P)-dependent oxidoreductase n=1 Tax=Elioraea rosea TaxID=2492390 RepID=UPI001181F9A1|nr:SDR family oxidoreductase [Elioraea rosea]
MSLRSDLTGMRLFVTGAGSGIGHALLRLALADGAAVACLARDEVEAQRLQALVAPERVLVADLRHGASGLVREAAARLGGLDGVALAAGLFDHRASSETDREAWQTVLDVNLTASFEMARDALPLLGSGGSIVLVSSQIGLVGHPRAAAYTASKAALNGLAKSLALEAAPRGVRVNAVAPGPIATPMTALARSDAARAERLLASIPLGRFGTAEEIAHTIRFLLSPAAGFITGAIVVADGGVTAA